MVYLGQQLSIKEKESTTTSRELVVERTVYGADVRYYHNGVFFDNGSSYCDVAKEKSCVDDAIEDAKGRCKYFKISKESSMEVRVILVKSVFEYTYKMSKTEYEELLSGSPWYTIDCSLREKTTNQTEKSKKESVAWSSKKHL